MGQLKLIKKKKHHRTHGFFSRKKTPSGRGILLRRLRKGRKRIVL